MKFTLFYCAAVQANIKFLFFNVFSLVSEYNLWTKAQKINETKTSIYFMKTGYLFTYFIMFIFLVFAEVEAM